MNKLNILHLEDSAEDSELAVTRLRAEGISCETVRVETRERFVEELERGGYDLIVSDYSLPRFNGREALRLAQEKRPDIPFIYLSGTIGEDVAIETLKKGANDYVLKNGMDRLAPAVVRALREAEEKAGRKKAEEGLKDSERRLAEAQELAHVGGWEVDLRTNVVTWTDEMYRIFGVHPQTFAPAYESYLERIHPEDRAAAEEAVRRILSDRQPFALDQRIVRPDGNVRSIHMRGRLIPDAEGRPAKLAGTIQDISEQKKLEGQLLQSRKMEAVGRLAGGVAHDFNNLLTVILGLCDFLLNDLKEPHRSEVVEIQKAGERAAALTRQLLAFSRRQVMQPEIADLNGIVSDVTQMLRRLLGEDVRLQMFLAPDLKRVKVDRGQVEQVIVNLAVNARDAMPTGGTLAIRTANAFLDETFLRQNEIASPEGPYALLAVEDNGCGMSDEVKANIFEPFFTTKGRGKGTGLGLSTVYGIVQQSGGFITVKTAPGRGTAFHLYFPQAAAPSEQEAAVRPGAPPRGSAHGPATVLLVEDEEEVRNLMSSILKKDGYRLLTAVGGNEALEVSGRFEGKIDLLVTDIVMPDMNGLELARRLVPTRPHLKVLYTSGYTDHEVFRSSQLASSAAFLPKPFLPAEFLRKVQEMLTAERPADIV